MGTNSRIALGHALQMCLLAIITMGIDLGQVIEL